MALPGAGRGARGKVRAAPLRAAATAGPGAGLWRPQPHGAVLGAVPGAAAGSAGGAAAPRPASRGGPSAAGGERGSGAAPRGRLAGLGPLFAGARRRGGRPRECRCRGARREARLGPARPGRDAGAGGAPGRAAGPRREPLEIQPQASRPSRPGGEAVRGDPATGTPPGRAPRPRSGPGSGGPRGGPAASRGLCAAPEVRGSPGSGMRPRGAEAPSLACGGADSNVARAGLPQPHVEITAVGVRRLHARFPCHRFVWNCSFASLRSFSWTFFLLLQSS